MNVIRSSEGLLIRDDFIVIFQRTPPASCSDTFFDKHACKTNQMVIAALTCIHQLKLNDHNMRLSRPIMSRVNNYI